MPISQSTSASLVGPLTPRPNISVKAKPTKVSSAALENRRRPAPYHEAGLLPFSRATIETFVGFAFTEMLSVSELNWLTCEAVVVLENEQELPHVVVIVVVFVVVVEPV